MKIHDIHEDITPNKRRKRLGRGRGSGLGKTAGKGHKGHQSRAGYSRQATFQGGMMPVVRRVPKRGFNNRFALTVATINIGDLQHYFEAGTEVSPESLRETGVLKSRYDLLKILGDGELDKKLKVSAHRFSKSAREKIEKAGGEVVELPGRAPVVKNKQASAKS